MATPRDLVILISASGNSDNINNASILCKQKGIKTLAISGPGEITKNPNSKANILCTIPVPDQQIEEDVMNSVCYLIVKGVAQYLEHGSCYIEHTKNDYISCLEKELGAVSPTRINSIALDIVDAFVDNKQIRIDAPDAGILQTVANHVTHNLKWDALSDIKDRPSNFVSTGVLTHHLTGVGNDGGDHFNYALEIEDNYKRDDVMILLAKDKESRKTKNVMRACNKKNMIIHILTGNNDDEFLLANILMTYGHLLGRIVNSYLVVHQESDNELLTLHKRLMQDLALLRHKHAIREDFKEKYET